MTNIELKELNNTNIRLKTQPKSITKVAVADALDNTIDYATQVATILNVATGLVANGTSISTTSVLSYGVNVFSTSTLTNYSTKLPAPTTGKSLKVVNNGAHPISIYPSITGGFIGTLPASTPITIPNNGQVYEFICIVNPTPGTWTVSNMLLTSLPFAELVISHTTGAETNKVGITTAGLTPSAGLGLDGNGNIILSGEWQSENSISTLVNLLIESNVVGADCASGFGNDRIAASFLTGYKTASNSTTNGDRHQINFLPGGYYTGAISPTGTLNTPPNIGDTGTLYANLPATASIIDEQVGLGGAYSRYYYTFAINIPASAATKVYRFRYTLQYI
jgi:hypothetical protein